MVVCSIAFAGGVSGKPTSEYADDIHANDAINAWAANDFDDINHNDVDDAQSRITIVTREKDLVLGVHGFFWRNARDTKKARCVFGNI